MKIFLRYIAYSLIGIFACIGVLFTAVFLAMQFGLLNIRGSISERNDFFAGAETLSPGVVCADDTQESCAWNQTPEWSVVSGGLRKDEGIIARVSQETGVSERMIAAVVVPEQTRFFTSNREVFKRYFEPLKILGSLSQFSLGVSGIKEATAKQIESQANDPASPFYPGDGLSALIAYPPGANHDIELYNRLTDAKNHYYSYLYTALYIKEIEEQWRRDGYDISQNPGAVVTLFNIGFQGSKPNPTPRAAGAVIATGGQSYTYGELGALFYNSQELTDIFPQ
jgi:hypothetical protein